MDTNTQKTLGNGVFPAVGEQGRIEAKMAELVAKWKDRPEPIKLSREWFERRGDRSLYVMLRSRLRKVSGGQQKLMSVDEQIEYCEKIGLIAPATPVKA